MRYRKVTEDGDFSFGASELDYLRDVPEAVGRAAQSRLLLFLGEWFLDVEEGTPYFISILGKHSQAEADATIQDRVINTQGMVGIENYASEVDPVNRRMSAAMDINTIYGPSTLDISNYTNF